MSRPITGKEPSAETAPSSTEAPKANVEKAAPQPAAPPAEKPDEMLDVIAPMANRGAGSNIVIASTEMATANELDEAALPETLRESEDSNQKTDSRPSSATSPPSSASEGRIEWIFQDGRWIPVQIDKPPKTSGTG